MTRVRVSTRIRAPRERVWAAVRDIGSHVSWMKDAEAIRFRDDRREGVGTTFDCDSRLGPFRVTDRMEVTEWDDGRALGIRHVGAVTGTGRFTLGPGRAWGWRRGTTRFRWEERLRFPWWMGGPLGGAVARPFFRRMWKGNLRRLKRLVEDGA
jgi:hypothetical protein